MLFFFLQPGLGQREQSGLKNLIVKGDRQDFVSRKIFRGHPRGKKTIMETRINTPAHPNPKKRIFITHPDIVFWNSPVFSLMNRELETMAPHDGNQNQSVVFWFPRARPQAIPARDEKPRYKNRYHTISPPDKGRPMKKKNQPQIHIHG